jgi:hypothetical protein
MDREPVEITGTFKTVWLPNLMIDPFPNWRSIWVRAISMARFLL